MRSTYFAIDLYNAPMKARRMIGSYTDYQEVILGNFHNAKRYWAQLCPRPNLKVLKYM